MLRLATPDYLRFCQANQFNATFGGGEANVAASLANYGIETEFVTRLPKMTNSYEYATMLNEVLPALSLTNNSKVSAHTPIRGNIQTPTGLMKS